MNQDVSNQYFLKSGNKQFDEHLPDDLKLDILDLLSNAKAQVSLLITNMDTGNVIVSYNEELKMVSASIIKVLILLSALEKVQEGELSLNSEIQLNQENILGDTEVFEYGERAYTLDELLNWMIINSDNTATNCLIDLLTMDSINTYAIGLSLKQTKLERKMLDFEAIQNGFNNYTSAIDIKILYDALYQNRILTPELCEYAIRTLKRQRHKQLAMRYIYDDVIIAHKTGSLDNLYHDVCIFYLENITYYFGMFVSDAVDSEYAAKLIGRISKMIYEYYKEK